MIDLQTKVLSLIFLGYAMDTVIAPNSGGLADLAKILGQLAGGDDCVFRCPKGYKPLANRSHKPSSNGCGSMGIKIDTTHFSGFTRCCDLHDICYDTCNNDRNQCDEDFKSCLDNECLLTGLGNRLPKEQLDSCQSSADLMYSGTYALGCMAYKEAQRNACLCNGRTLTKKEMEDLERNEEL
ncbi:group XIIA secretory phospholipase A2-like [Acropora palmata]|uniref:group XIIA secretory phospholipase A2-like n=1 Tax=Acropora palmata TaxID=6131 RepID=UPI003DA0CDDA